MQLLVYGIIWYVNICIHKFQIYYLKIFHEKEFLINGRRFSTRRKPIIFTFFFLSLPFHTLQRVILRKKRSGNVIKEVFENDVINSEGPTKMVFEIANSMLLLSILT